MAEPDRSTTERGFVIYDQFTDTYDWEIRVQESSSAEEPRCWIFVRNGDDHAAAHLNMTMAKRVRDALDAFISEHDR